MSPIPNHCPYKLGDRVQLHGYAGAFPPGPRQTGWRGTVTGYMGSTILTVVTDDGRKLSEHWGWLVPDGKRDPGGVIDCTCCPPRPRRRAKPKPIEMFPLCCLPICGDLAAPDDDVCAGHRARMNAMLADQPLQEATR